MGPLKRLRVFKRFEKAFKDHPDELLVTIQNLWGYTSGKGALHLPASMSIEALSNQGAAIPNHGEHVLVVTDAALYRGDEPEQVYRIPFSNIEEIDFGLEPDQPVREVAIRANSEGIENGHPAVQYWYVSTDVAVDWAVFSRSRGKGTPRPWGFGRW